LFKNIFGTRLNYDQKVGELVIGKKTHTIFPE